MTTKDIHFKRLDDIKDKYLGKEGTPDREQYEFDLKLDVLGDMIKHLRNEKNLTQTQLGELVGVKRAEISKLEKGSRNMTIATVLKVFKALETDIKFKIETTNNELNLA
jgi:DNA-binding XRE family transcriptional regulator